MINPQRFVEFWEAILRFYGPYIWLIIGNSGIVLTLYSYFKRLKRASAAFYLKTYLRNPPNIIIRSKEHFITLATLSFLAFFLMMFTFLSIVYSIEWPEMNQYFVSLVTYALASLISILIFLAASFPFSERFIRFITGIKFDRVTKEHFYHCPHCRCRFLIQGSLIVLNPTRDLVLGFKCPHCEYIAKL